jgi:hypothetical protein
MSGNIYIHIYNVFHVTCIHNLLLYIQRVCLQDEVRQLEARVTAAAAGGKAAPGGVGNTPSQDDPNRRYEAQLF